MKPARITSSLLSAPWGTISVHSGVSTFVHVESGRHQPGSPKRVEHSALLVHDTAPHTLSVQYVPAKAGPFAEQSASVSHCSVEVSTTALQPSSDSTATSIAGAPRPRAGTTIKPSL